MHVVVSTHVCNFVHIRHIKPVEVDGVCGVVVPVYITDNTTCGALLFLSRAPGMLNSLGDCVEVVAPKALKEIVEEGVEGEVKKRRERRGEEIIQLLSCSRSHFVPFSF